MMAVGDVEPSIARIVACRAAGSPGIIATQRVLQLTR